MTATKAMAGDAEPPDHEVAGVVDGRRRAGGEALLVEPDRLEVERPGPPRRRCGVGRRAGCCGSGTSGRSGRAGSARCDPAGQPVHDLVAADHRPRAGTRRRRRRAAGRSGTRRSTATGRPRPARGGASPPAAGAGGSSTPDRVVERRRRRQRPEAPPSGQLEDEDERDRRRGRARGHDRTGVSATEPITTERVEPARDRAPRRRTTRPTAAGAMTANRSSVFGPGDRVA